MPGNAYVSQSLTTRSTGIIPGTLRKPYPPFNEFDKCLADDMELWESLVANGGLAKFCCPQGRKPYKNSPWISMPAEGRRFKPIGNITVASITPFTGLDVLVLSEKVPTGYNGVITDIVCELASIGSTGFAEGSGDVAWRLSADGRFLRDQGNLQVTIGSLVTPSPVPRGGLRVYSQDVIEFFVAMTVGAEARINPDARVICSITGWWWPR